jgi:predicted oxidoreductase
MDKYKIPRTDLEASKIAYGCMKLGGSWDDTPFGKEEVIFASKAVRSALDQGINFFDHADIYCKGKSERVFAEVIKEFPGIRNDLILQSKCGILFKDDPNPGDPVRYNFSYDYIVSATEGILKRLNTDYIDILLLHRPDPLVEPGEVARAFDLLHRNGKVRYFGVSNHNAAQISLLQKYLDQPIVANQIELNILHSHIIYEGITWNIENPAIPPSGGTLEYCRENDIMIQAWGPLANGRFIDPPEDCDKRTLATARLVEKLASQKNTTKEAITLSWLLRHPAKILPIIGTTNSKRISASCLADEINLSREEWYRLFAAGRGQEMP